MKTCGNIKRYLKTWTYKDIKSLKEDILDQWNNLDESYRMYRPESMSRRVGTWILIMEDKQVISFF